MFDKQKFDGDLMEQLLQKRRSIRKFKDKEIPSQIVDSIMKSVLFSPTGNNKKEWEFIVVDNRELLDKLAVLKNSGAGKLIKNAPMAVVVLGDSTRSDVWIEDCSIAATILQLLLESYGLGSCWVQVRLRMADENQTTEEFIQKLLSIPEHQKVEMILAFGYPNEVKSKHDYAKSDYSKIKYNNYNSIYSKRGDD